MILYFSVCECYTPEQVGKYEAWEDNEVDESRKCPVAFNEIGGRCYFYGYFKLNWYDFTGEVFILLGIEPETPDLC